MTCAVSLSAKAGSAYIPPQTVESTIVLITILFIVSSSLEAGCVWTRRASRQRVRHANGVLAKGEWKMRRLRTLASCAYGAGIFSERLAKHEPARRTNFSATLSDRFFVHFRTQHRVLVCRHAQLGFLP